jgi:LuxR family maltose regulon positive regulatory protein
MEELILKDYLLYITKETFELTPEEIVTYYNLYGINISNIEANKLYYTTEGWISALYLLMLNYKSEGRFLITDNIYKLVEKAIYNPFSDDIKEFFIHVCILDSFTIQQAVYIWGNENADNFLSEICRKNAFINYDVNTKTYHIHNIYTNYLKEILEKKDENYKKKLFKKAGEWCVKKGEYLEAMHYFNKAEDFEKLLSIMELDKGNSFGNEHKELIIKYFEECPQEYKKNHIVALLVYAMALVTFNEMGLFQKVCKEITVLIEKSSLDSDRMNFLMGEVELLLSFTRYNDIKGMSEHHKKACELMKEPSIFMATKGSWTFGSPSILYMFYRESGKLEQEVYEIKEAMPCYYRLTNGHGMGAEYVMEAERYFMMGDFENAEILVHKALCQARSWNQSNIVICALFLQIRLALVKSDYDHAINLFRKMHEEIEQKQVYMLIHTIDMCKGFVNAFLQQSDKIPEWQVEGDYKSRRLWFPTHAFFNIVYGRILLIKGEYLKLLGTAEHFYDIASYYSNMLANIYTSIYIAAANERIYRRGEAFEAINHALDIAAPDKVYMPFVENCDYIKPLLEQLYSQNIHHKDIENILKLHKPYQKAIDSIKREYFKATKAKLSERETEIARLASEGYSNKAIAERLYISQNTVKTQLKSIFEKTGVNSRFLLKRYFQVNQFNAPGE